MDLGRSMFRDLASAAQTNLAAAAQSVNTAAQSAATNVKGSTTRELLQRIEDQDMELLKYKKRTRDLVHSYKSLIEEKKKLEQTLETFNNVDPMVVAAPISEKTAEPSKSADIETSPSKKSPKRLKKGKLGTRIQKKPEDEGSELQKTHEKLQLTADNFPLPETDTETNQSKPISDDNALYKNYQSDKEDEKDGDNNTHYKEQFHINQQQLSIMSKQIKALKTQLTDALSSSSKQKEAFLTDKKIMKNDYETKIKKLESKVQASDENFKITSDQLKNIKEQLRLTITEKEKTSDQLTKLRRESQTEILNYKKKISDLEQLYEKEKSAKIEINAKIAKDDGENLAKDEMLTRYKQELKDTLDKLKVAEEKLSKPDEKMTAQIKHLREELEYRKNDYAEKTKHLSASKIRLESRLKDLEKHNETTRKDLENQIFDLTTTIGVTEKTRTKDQETVAQLRARIDVLDLENLNLLSKAKGNNELKVSELPKIMFDVCSRDIEVTNIFSTLLTQTRKAVNEEISLSAIANVFPEIRTQFDKKLQNLKDENLSLQREVKIFRENPLDSSASSLNTSVNNQDTTTILSKSLRESEDIIEQLKLANLNLTTKSEELENDLRNVKLTHRNQVSSLNLEFDNKIKDNNQNWRAKFASLDEELIAQRERSLKILNDKEKELQQLRTQVFSTTPPATPDNANMNPLDISVGTDRLSVDSTGLQGELADKMDESIYRINYTEKLARKDIELENLKKQNKEFSKRIRNLQDKILEIDDKHQAEITQYKDRIATAINPNNYNMSRKESSASIHSGVDINSVQTQNQNKSANSNEDYIKNVLFNYLILPQKNKARGHMLNALASALHFTNEELNRVKSTQKL